MTRSTIDILITTVRGLADGVLAQERLRLSGADEFTQAKMRRAVVDSAEAALLTAEMAEAVVRQALAGAGAQIAALRTAPLPTVVANADHPPTPDPPAAA